MAYKVIKSFVDLQDNNYRYRVGDTFPHANKTVSEERLAELASGKNKLRQPLIEAVVKKVVEPEPIIDEKIIEKMLDDADEVVDVPVEEADEVVEEPKAEKPKRRGRPPKKTTKEDE